MTLVVELAGARYRLDPTRAFDLSIPLHFGGPQPNLFGAPRAASRPLASGSFFGDTRQGGSCNCEEHQLVPHCNGTHTECVGHVTTDRMSIRDVATEALVTAALISVAPSAAAQNAETSDPSPRPGDRLITRSAIEAGLATVGIACPDALVVRTLPNEPGKRDRSYRETPPPPFFSAEAMRDLVQRGVRHLLTDVPSVDRIRDEGRLTGHRIFWGLPPGARDLARAARPAATITEMVFVPEAVRDGRYLLNLQLAPFMSDAAPSRPLLYALEPL
jgi:arylformamidase